MVITKGGHTQKDVYGLKRISSELSQTSGTLDNIETDIAKNDIQKFYYHQNRMGSTAYATLWDDRPNASEKARVIGYTNYDEWGKITTDTDFGTNFAGMDNITDYTGHNYDKVLDKYFAQYRIYDAENKRFMARDPVKDGANWYSYVGNSPVNFIDIIGLYSIIFASDEMRGHAEARKQECTNKYGTETYIYYVDSAKDFVWWWNKEIDSNNKEIDAIEILSHGGTDENKVGYLYFATAKHGAEEKGGRLYAKFISDEEYSVDNLFNAAVTKEFNIIACNGANPDTYNVVYGFITLGATGKITGFDGGSDWNYRDVRCLTA